MTQIELTRQRLREEADAAVREANTLAGAKTLTASDRKKIDTKLAHAASLRSQAAALKSDEERVALLNATLDEMNMPRVAVPTEESRSIEARQDKAFRSYLRSGERISAELRSELSTDPSSAGAFIPRQFANEYQARLISYSGIRDAGAKIVTTSHAGAFDYPFSDDSGNNGVRITEGTLLSTTSPVAALNSPNAWPYSSQGFTLTNSLVDDIGFDVSAYVQDLAARRIGSITNSEFTLGASGGPSGVIPNLTVAVTTASPTAVLLSELTQLIASINPSYKQAENKPCFSFSPSVESALKAMTTSTGAKLFPEMDEGKLLGYRYVLNVDMASLTSTSKAIAFGSFLRGVTVRETTPILVVSKERYAEFSQTFYSMFHRQDCVITDPNAVKLLQMHA